MATIELSDDELKTLRDVLNVGQALISSASPSQVAGLAGRIGEIMPALEIASSPRMAQSLSRAGDDIADLIDLMVTYHKSGTFKKALDLVTFVSVIRDALSTPTATHLAESANEFLLKSHRLVSELSCIGGVEGLMAAADEASAQTEQDKGTIGFVGLLRALKEPEVQRAIKFLLHFLRIIGKRAQP